jgi:hypothetical protein
MLLRGARRHSAVATEQSRRDTSLTHTALELFHARSIKLAKSEDAWRQRK